MACRQLAGYQPLTTVYDVAGKVWLGVSLVLAVGSATLLAGLPGGVGWVGADPEPLSAKVLERRLELLTMTADRPSPKG
jgi:hypothetical protein